MKLPNHRKARVGREKVLEYLLSTSHREGKHKALFFTRFGFTRNDWRTLAAALLKHARDNDLFETKESPYGMRYVIEGRLKVPDRRQPMIRSIWFVEHGENEPKFVTAYPVKKKTSRT